MSQAFLTDSAMIISQMMVAALLHNDHDKDNEHKVAATRKIGVFMTRTLGMSFRDLPDGLRTRVEEFGKKPSLGSSKGCDMDLVVMWM